MTNLGTDEMAFSHSFTKIGTDENKAIYSMVLDSVFGKENMCLRMDKDTPPDRQVLKLVTCNAYEGHVWSLNSQKFLSILYLSKLL